MSKAVELEKALLAAEIERNELYRSESAQQDVARAKTEDLHVQKKMLELDLLSGGAEAPVEEEADAVARAQAVAGPPVSPPVAAQEAKTASLDKLASKLRMKLAVEKLKQAAAPMPAIVADWYRKMGRTPGVLPTGSVGKLVGSAKTVVAPAAAVAQKAAPAAAAQAVNATAPTVAQVSGGAPSMRSMASGVKNYLQQGASAIQAGHAAGGAQGALTAAKGVGQQGVQQASSFAQRNPRAALAVGGGAAVAAGALGHKLLSNNPQQQ